MNQFKQVELITITEVNRHTFQIYVKDGLIIPSVHNASGRGAKRLYGPGDLTLTKIVFLLSQLSYNRALIKSFCNYANFATVIKKTFSRKTLGELKIKHGNELEGIDTKKILDPKVKDKSPLILSVVDNEKVSLRYMADKPKYPIDKLILKYDFSSLTQINVTKIKRELRLKMGS